MKLVKRILETLFIFNLIVYIFEFISKKQDLIQNICNIICIKLRLSTSVTEILLYIINLNLYITIIGGILFLYDMFLNQKKVN